MAEKNEIIKCGAHCYDGCGWDSCYFWDRSEEKSKCMLFGGIDGVEKIMSRAIPQCNKIFGTCYEKRIETYEEEPGVVVSRSEKFRGEWVIVIGFNAHTVIAHDKDMEKAIEKAKKVGVPIVGKVGDVKRPGILIYIPREDETLIGGRYYKIVKNSISK